MLVFSNRWTHALSLQSYQTTYYVYKFNTYFLNLSISTKNWYPALLTAACKFPSGFSSSANGGVRPSWIPFGHARSMSQTSPESGSTISWLRVPGFRLHSLSQSSTARISSSTSSTSGAIGVVVVTTADETRLPLLRESSSFHTLFSVFKHPITHNIIIQFQENVKKNRGLTDFHFPK